MLEVERGFSLHGWPQPLGGQEVLGIPLWGQVWLNVAEEPPPGMGGLLGLQRRLLVVNVLGGGFLAGSRPAAPVAPGTHRSKLL